MTWAQVGRFIVIWYNKILAIIFRYLRSTSPGRILLRLLEVISAVVAWAKGWIGRFWRWFTRSGGGGGSIGSFIASKPILILLGLIAVWFADFLANYFGYSFVSILVFMIVSIVSTVLAWWLDFVWTLIDFSSLIAFMEYWSGLPTCFTEVALAAGLGGALSALFATATACITITFIQSLIKR